MKVKKSYKKKKKKERRRRNHIGDCFDQLNILKKTVVHQIQPAYLDQEFEFVS